MQVLRITNFGGIVPRLGARLLPDNNAQVAVNTKLFSGELRAWNRGRPIADVPVVIPRTVYRYDYEGRQRFLSFDQDTYVVKAPLVNDTSRRIYWANTDGVRYNSMDRIEGGEPDEYLGTPAPSLVNVSVTAAGGSSTTTTTRVYIVSLVSRFGEEGPSSQPYTASGKVDSTWTVTNLSTVSYDSETYTGVTKVRLYRTVTSDTGVDYRLVHEWPIELVPAVFVDTVPDTTVATSPAYQAFEWSPPPRDLTGLISVAGGFLAGFRGRELWLSVPYYPHAWPESYKLVVEDDIVALGTFGNTIVVTTKGEPYAAVGTSPDTMSLSKFDKVLPCLSPKGLVQVSGAVLYPSTDGLVSISSGGYQIISQPYVTKDEWLTRFSPTAIRASVYQDRYFAMYTSTLGFTIGFDDPTTGFTEVFSATEVTSVDLDRTTGQTLITTDQKVYEWDDDRGSRLTYTWRSKPFLTPKPVGYAALQIRGDFLTNTGGGGELVGDNILNHDLNEFPVHGREDVGYPINGPGFAGVAAASGDNQVETRVYCDKRLIWRGVVSSEAPVRLPSGYKGVQWEVELVGKASVYSVTLSTTAKGLEATP